MARRWWAAVGLAAALVATGALVALPPPGGDPALELSADDRTRGADRAVRGPLGQPLGRAARPLPVSVAPAADLVDGQPVEVRGWSFSPGASVGIVPCSRAARSSGGADHCDLAVVGPATAGGDGTWRATYLVRRFIVTPADGEIDCAGARCFLAAGNLADDGEFGRADLGFRPGPAPPPPELAARPAAGLREGDDVAVAGSGFRPGAALDLVQCVSLGTGPSLERCHPREVAVTADAQGRVAARYPVTRVIRRDGRAHDCAVAPGRCVLTTGRGAPGDRVAWAPLAFDPG